MRALRLAVLVLLALPGIARAGDVAMVMRDLPVDASRHLASAPVTRHFNMLGIHWQGSGRVLYRAHRLHGGWSAWLDADADTRPDVRSAEARATRLWHDGSVIWAGASDGFRYRTVGAVRRVRAYFLWSRVDKTAPRALSFADQPAIIPRSSWKADESIRRAKPRYAPAVRLAIVHHTAGSNSYTRAQSAAIVRGIQVFHVKGNGWDDIGYNFLIDRYGQVFEGRYGGIDRNVIGAHAEGFNTGTVGISLIGNYTSATITAAQRDALVKLLAWRLDVAHVDPLSTLVWRSSGNPKFRSGTMVKLRAVSGHRDTGFTSCPGSVYGELASLARAAQATGLPKLYEPVVQGALGQSVRFRARLSAPLPWTVRVSSAQGRLVASGRGVGMLVDWAWDSSRAGRGPFAWSIDSDGVRSATGTIGGTLPPSTPTLSGLTANPAVVLPAVPGSTGATTISFTLGRQARVNASVTDGSGAQVVTLIDEPRKPGPQTINWVAGALPDGRYTVHVTARPPGLAPASATADVVVDRMITGFSATPATFSPNGDGVLDAITFAFGLAATTPGRVEVVQNGVVVATPLPEQTLEAGDHTLTWDGTNGEGRLADGAYEVRLTATGVTGEVSISTPFTLDTIPPELRILDAARLQFWLSEPATVTLYVNGQQLVRPEPQGSFSIPFAAQVSSLSASATDAAGNVSVPVQWPP